jgi:hypothetical protein
MKGATGGAGGCLAIGRYAACLLLAACATTSEKSVYVDWLAVANPSTLCQGQADCVQHSTYRGKPLCTIVTADKAVSYARLGEQVRECLK